MKDCPQCHVLLDDAEATCPQCHHNFNARPVAAIAACPHCGGELPSALAKLCPNCRTPLGMAAPAGPRPSASGGRPAAPGPRPTAPGGRPATAPSRSAPSRGPQAPPQGSWVPLYVGGGLLVALFIVAHVLSASLPKSSGLDLGTLTSTGSGMVAPGPNFHYQSDDLHFTNNQPERQNGQFVIDGKVKNLTHQPITGLVIHYMYVNKSNTDHLGAGTEEVTVGEVPADSEVPFHATFPAKNDATLVYFGTSNN